MSCWSMASGQLLGLFELAKRAGEIECAVLRTADSEKFEHGGALGELRKYSRLQHGYGMNHALLPLFPRIGLEGWTCALPLFDLVQTLY